MAKNTVKSIAGNPVHTKRVRVYEGKIVKPALITSSKGGSYMGGCYQEGKSDVVVRDETDRAIPWKDIGTVMDLAEHEAKNKGK